MPIPIRLAFLVALVAILTATHAQQAKKRAIDDGPERIQLADPVIAKDRTLRQSKKSRTRTTTPRPLGFFGTIWKLVKEQVNDTRSAYDQLSVLVSDQFSDTQLPTTKAPVTDNSTTTAAPPPKISRKEFLNILRKNLIGLRRLYNLELREALSDSRKNIREYQKEFHRELYKQFKDK